MLAHAETRSLQCPLPASWSDPSSHCRNRCSKDIQCPLGFRCCFNNAVCSSKFNNSNSTSGFCLPGIVTIGSRPNLPTIPEKPRWAVRYPNQTHTFPMHDEDSLFEADPVIDLNWLEKPNQEEPVVYLLQIRQYEDKDGSLITLTHQPTRAFSTFDVLGDSTTEDMQFNESKFSPWMNLRWVTVTATEMESLGRGFWSQFRVQAFNRFGSAGFSQPTEPIRPKPLFRVVPMPTNIRLKSL
ncbi:hypothetical protein Ciccas_003266 [Cichlidogyrus casuarinus]|uniref:WAP domain-containing protein n=1 Tax=Cichlidogyrus casuarinus TaxID=1844966 RepID=A0ABD2QEU7_9PLAT